MRKRILTRYIQEKAKLNKTYVTLRLPALICKVQASNRVLNVKDCLS